MRPVSKGAKVGPFSNHGLAKPELVARIGAFCSYCESPAGRIQNIDVEHIYSQHAYPTLSCSWSNFLLACSTCNNYKSRRLGNGMTPRLLRLSYWPHLDNTFNAFVYFDDGRVEVRPGAGPLAQQLMDMAGLMRSPAVAERYEALAIAYDGITIRHETWGIATVARVVYEQNPSLEQERLIVISAKATGQFSIWMNVFHDIPRMRQLFINGFNADPNCFDPVTTLPIRKGRI